MYHNIETLRTIRELVNNLIDAKSLHRTAMLASEKAKTLTGNDKLAWEDSARNCRTARDELLGMARYYMKHLKTTHQTTKPSDLIGLPTVKGDNHVSL